MDHWHHQLFVLNALQSTVICQTIRSGTIRARRMCSSNESTANGSAEKAAGKGMQRYPGSVAGQKPASFSPRSADRAASPPALLPLLLWPAASFPSVPCRPPAPTRSSTAQAPGSAGAAGQRLRSPPPAPAGTLWAVCSPPLSRCCIQSRFSLCAWLGTKQYPPVQKAG